MILTLPSDQKQLLGFVDRRHPRYNEMFSHWSFCQSTYEGGRGWFTKNIHHYLKEGDGEYGDRLRRAYRFNHTREVTSLVTKYIFKEGIIRNNKDAPAPVKKFWDCATTDGAAIDELMKRVSDQSSIAGRAWIVVDSNFQNVVSIADETNGTGRVYAYIVSQEDVLDYSMDDRGAMRWILYRIPFRDDIDPINSSGVVVPRYMLWTTEEWVLLEERAKTTNGPTLSSAVPLSSPIIEGVQTAMLLVTGNPEDRREIFVVDRGVNKIGPSIPVVPVNHMETDELYAPPGLVDEIAYLDRTVANYLSNLDAIIQDQTFSQLVMPAQNMMPGEDEYNKLKESGTSRIFIYDGEGGQAPQYISPDASQAELVISVIKMIIGEIYHSVGMAGERTKQDNAQGIDNSSGVAKAYDFERMNALLCAKAAQLDRAENRIVDLVCQWSGTKNLTEDLIKYPESYDVRALPDEMEIAQNLAILEAPASLRREQMTVMLDKLFPRLAKDMRVKIIDEMKDWPVDPLDQMQQVMQLQGSADGKPALGTNKLIKKVTPTGDTGAAAQPGTNKEGLTGDSSKSNQGQAGTK